MAELHEQLRPTPEPEPETGPFDELAENIERDLRYDCSETPIEARDVMRRLGELVEILKAKG